ncbi:MAG: hypothetical protein PHY64_03525 [Eubacteriales bacterium]|nr:hypothetical protein [Eubacteriales bacterium]
MSCYYVIGVRMDNRTANALRFQEALTKNGCKIRARLGLHEAGGDVCANDGLIVLQPCGEKAEVEQLTGDLNALEGVTAKLIDLNL